MITIAIIKYKKKRIFRRNKSIPSAAQVDTVSMQYNEGYFMAKISPVIDKCHTNTKNTESQESRMYEIISSITETVNTDSRESRMYETVVAISDTMKTESPESRVYETISTITDMMNTESRESRMYETMNSIREVGNL